ncbi:hypothetical protein K1719_014433 [Acacia pycnantha]|nr:hypothetical protein K1719_014433 [Acacia pycnantha]
MAKQYSSIVFLCVSFFILASIFCDAIDDTGDDRKTYIVYMGSLPEESSYSPTSHHLSILKQVINGGEDDDALSGCLIHSYKRSFNGFAAKLTEEEREKIAQMKEIVVSVFPSATLETHTTRSWDFIGFHESIKRQPAAESDVIIGVLDTGIWPASDSFSDLGFGPVPNKWKGSCGGGKDFNCNKKIIGARFYVDDSAIDNDGHGTHTASIAAGNKVNDASFYGLAQGTARGAVPSSRIAAYKVCNLSGCNEAKVLAAFDDAIADGVDILSVSLGKPGPTDFKNDTISIGSFHAMAKGILTVNSAGNNGPDPTTVSSVAPWLFTVASSTIDRRIIDKVVLGDGKTLTGNSVNSFASNGTKFPIALKNGDSERCPKPKADECDCLEPSLVRGKIVLCTYPDEEDKAFSAGATGAITQDDGEGNVSYVSSLPSLTLDSGDFDLVRSYIRSNKDPRAEILKSEAVEDCTAPIVADDSSRGPNAIVAEILKPDIAAPGVDILAAFSPIASPSGNPGDKRSVKYNIQAGTSMACPHVTGTSAYVKTFHPDWSPAAVKSAIMTTAKPMKIATNNVDHVGEFCYGSGHVNPVQAVDPGLIYDLSKQDYIQMLCNLGYDLTTIRQISGDKTVTCHGSPDRSLVKNTNYPSLGITVQANQPFNVKINRTVTNVGSANSNYKVTVLVPNSKLMSIKVEPQTLSFKSLNEKQSFVVTIVGGKLPKAEVLASSLVWSDGTHNVRSPILVSFE